MLDMINTYPQEINFIKNLPALSAMAPAPGPEVAFPNQGQLHKRQHPQPDQ